MTALQLLRADIAALQECRQHSEAASEGARQVIAQYCGRGEPIDLADFRGAIVNATANVEAHLEAASARLPRARAAAWREGVRGQCRAHFDSLVAEIEEAAREAAAREQRACGDIEAADAAVSAAEGARDRYEHRMATFPHLRRFDHPCQYTGCDPGGTMGSWCQSCGYHQHCEPLYCHLGGRLAPESDKALKAAVDGFQQRVASQRQQADSLMEQLRNMPPGVAPSSIAAQLGTLNADAAGLAGEIGAREEEATRRASAL